MVKKTDKVAKIAKVALAVVSGAALLTTGALGGAMMFPQTEIVEKEVPVEVPQIEYVNRTVVEDREVIKEVPDEYLSNALIERDIVDEDFEPREVFMAEDEALAMALTFLEDEFADALEDENIVDDEDDVRLIRMYGDWDDVEMTESDFKDKEYEFIIRAKFEDDDLEEKKFVLATVRVEDGEPELIEVVEE